MNRVTREAFHNITHTHNNLYSLLSCCCYSMLLPLPLLIPMQSQSLCPHLGGSFSKLVVSFHFKRLMGSFMIEVYAPGILLVVLSWVSFWINREATADRISLGKLLKEQNNRQINQFTLFTHSVSLSHLLFLSPLLPSLTFSLTLFFSFDRNSSNSI